MRSLLNKHILLGVTGGIAAYKSAEIIRRLIDLGATVKVVMTRSAHDFITPLTLQALSGNSIHTELLDIEAEAAMGHIELARWADLILITPASANFIAKMAAGQADDLLSTICLASRSVIAVAPAMNQAMWRNKSTMNNITNLDNRGIKIFGPDEGSQACGDEGPGRMLEPQDIANLASGLFETGSLAGLKVVITAGPTREDIDPVRYISNNSSGKMGYALVEAALEAGADTTLISGPVSLNPPDRAKTIHVKSAKEMHEVSIREAVNCQLFIACAAVADYRPKQKFTKKIKKDSDFMDVSLIKNPDIASDVSALCNKPFTVGFAAETQENNESLEKIAFEKLQRKKLDLIIANNISNESIGFESDYNSVVVIDRNSSEIFPRMRKTQLSRQLISKISQKIKTKNKEL